MSARARRLIATAAPARVALSLCGGALVATALPPLGWWPAAPVGCAALCVAVRGASLRSRLLSGWCFGLGQLSIGLLFVLQFSALGYFVLFPIEALFMALVACDDSGLGLCGALCLAEWARERIPFGGLPPGGIPLGSAASPFAPLARLGGPALLTLAVGATGTALGFAAIAMTRRLRHRPFAGRVGVGALALASGVVLLVALATIAPSGGAPVGYVRAVAVQGGGVRGLSQIDAPSIGAFGRTLTESTKIATRVELELWPEDTVPLTEGTANLLESPLGGALSSLARRGDLTLLAGVTEPVGTTRFLNEVVAFDPTGTLAGSIEKVHAVPFGEYVPMRSLLSHLVVLSAVPRDAVVGHNDGVLGTSAGRIGVLISFETFFESRGSDEVRAGAELLVAPTNTASYATSQVPEQELAASRLQAIATGRDLLQAATTGVSALVAPNGVVLARTALGVPALVSATVPLRSGRTLYDRFGETPTLLVATGLVIADLARRERSRRSRRRGAAPRPA